MPSPDKEQSLQKPALAELFLSFLRLGLTAFGGPAMVAYIGEMSVKRKQWLDQQSFKAGTALAQSIPGATAMQVAAYVGLQARGLRGAILSYVGFGLPAFLFMLILSTLYAVSRNVSWVGSLFAGLQVIVVAIVANGSLTFGKTSLKRLADAVIAAASTAALLIAVSPFYVIIGAAAIGALVPGKESHTSQPRGTGRGGSNEGLGGILALTGLFLAGLVCLYIVNAALLRLALLMLKVDLFAFGGGFASLPLMLQEVVGVRGWMDNKTFMDGIALGQITPGPIVITATFVGYLVHGLAGAAVATVAIFTPSFLLLVGTAPFFHRLRQSPVFTRAVQGILASFVGLLLYVAIRFALAVPWDVPRICLAVAALIAILRKVDLLYVVLIGAGISVFLFRFFGP
jgi:chromate transporter